MATHCSVLGLDVVVRTVVYVLEVPEYYIEGEKQLVPGLDLRLEDQICQLLN
jgi:hypothetical protein